METYWGNAFLISPVVSFTPQPLYPREKNLWHPLEEMLQSLQVEQATNLFRDADDVDQ
jgi:hypothetical protein